MFSSRIKLTKLILGIFLCLVLIRLFYWQVVRGKSLEARAVDQHQTTVTLSANRGSILASDGSLLAGTETKYQLFLYKPQLDRHPLELVDPLTPILAEQNDIASSSAEILPTVEELVSQTKDYLRDRLSLDRSYIIIKNHLSRSQKDRIDELDIPGLGFEEQNVRFYPEASMSAHILGFVGQDVGGQPKGYFGLEGFYDRHLQGRKGLIAQETDAEGNPIIIGDFKQYFSQDGRDLETTINRSFQHATEKILEDGVLKYGAKTGSAILMDTSTGAILSMANYPAYDPRVFYKFEPVLHKNPVVADLFEPGSIFKPLVIAAALDKGLVEPDTKCDSTCNAPVTIGSFTIRTWNDQYHPGTDISQIIANSDNTGMIFVARKLEPDGMYQYLDNFGFGHSTGIDLQEEAEGILKPANKWHDIDLATISFGQGIAVTRIQVLAAINALANKGVWVAPHIVRNITTGDKTITPSLPANKQVVSKETSEKITQIMQNAVENGDARWAKPKNIKIAGKTGTAQIPVEGHYDEKKTIASFVGFFPADNPQYTMLVTLREPTSSPWGSETAAPLWFKIANEIILLQ